MLAALALALTLSAPADLTAIQTAVNLEGTQSRDQRHAWAPLSEKGWVGDCKDFALEKRKELIAAGYDAKRLIVWLGFERGPHAVLIVDHAWVLDSLQDGVEPLGHQHVSLVCPAADLSTFVKNDNDLNRCGGGRGVWSVSVPMITPRRGW